MAEVNGLPRRSRQHRPFRQASQRWLLSHRAGFPLGRERLCGPRLLRLGLGGVSWGREHGQELATKPEGDRIVVSEGLLVRRNEGD